MTAHYEIRITFFTNNKKLAKTVNLVKLPVLTRKSNRSIRRARDGSISSLPAILGRFLTNTLWCLQRTPSGAAVV